MADAFIKIQLEGTEDDGGDVRLGEFIEELTAIKNALKRTERLVVRNDAQAINYKIVNLTHSSPATITLAISPRDPVYKDAPRMISRRFTSSLQMVRKAHRYAERIDHKTLQDFKSIVAPTNKHISRITVTGERNQSIQIDLRFQQNLTSLLERDERERDEIVGRLERLDIHNKTQFDIYPLIGATRIKCIAPKRLYQDVVDSVGRLVSVDGWAHYRKDSPFPYAISVLSIEKRTNDEELPLMSDLHGIAPSATDGKNGEDFIRELRDANW